MNPLKTLLLGLGTLAIGCAVEASDDIGTIDQEFEATMNGTCSATNQVAAEIFRTVMIELGRYKPGLDINKKDGTLVLTPTGEARCVARGGCRQLKSLLSYQFLSNLDRANLADVYPWMPYLQEGDLRNKLVAGIEGDWYNPRPNQVPDHETAAAAILPDPDDLCTGTKFHCFSMLSGDATAVRTAMGAIIGRTDLKNLVRIETSPEGWICLDPTGAPGDQTTGGSPLPVCVDGTIPQLASAVASGSCCTKADGTFGTLVPHARYPQYLVCV